MKPLESPWLSSRSAKRLPSWFKNQISQCCNSWTEAAEDDVFSLLALNRPDHERLSGDLNP